MKFLGLLDNQKDNKLQPEDDQEERQMSLDDWKNIYAL